MHGSDIRVIEVRRNPFKTAEEAARYILDQEGRDHRQAIFEANRRANLQRNPSRARDHWLETAAVLARWKSGKRDGDFRRMPRPAGWVRRDRRPVWPCSRQTADYIAEALRMALPGVTEFAIRRVGATVSYTRHVVTRITPARVGIITVGLRQFWVRNGHPVVPSPSCSERLVCLTRDVRGFIQDEPRGLPLDSFQPGDSPA